MRLDRRVGEPERSSRPLPFGYLSRLQVDSAIHPGVPESFSFDVLFVRQSGQRRFNGFETGSDAAHVFFDGHDLPLTWLGLRG